MQGELKMMIWLPQGINQVIEWKCKSMQMPRFRFCYVSLDFFSISIRFLFRSVPSNDLLHEMNDLYWTKNV